MRLRVNTEEFTEVSKSINKTDKYSVSSFTALFPIKDNGTQPNFDAQNLT